MTSEKSPIRSLPRNVWAVSVTSFFMDISSEMVLNILPLSLSSVLGVKTNVIGLIEGIAEATASLLKVFSGWLSDKLRARKWLAVAGYGIATLAKPFFYWANSWGAVYGLYYGLAYGTTKAMVADIVAPEVRGTAYGTYNAVLGILDFPASLIAGILWQGIGTWEGLGASAPFYFGAGTAFIAALAMASWKPSMGQASQAAQ